MTNFEWIKTLSIEEMTDLMLDSKDYRGCEIVNGQNDDCSGECWWCLKAYLESEHQEEYVAPVLLTQALMDKEEAE